MTTLTIELPETVFSALHADPKEFTREMRIAAAIKWYELGRVSQRIRLTGEECTINWSQRHFMRLIALYDKA